MNICFYLYGADHLFCDVLENSKVFNDKFKSAQFYYIADNRTHKDAYEKRGYNVLYLSDINKNNFSKYPPSNNLFISMKRYNLIDKPAYQQENIFNLIQDSIKKYLVNKEIDLLIFPKQIESMEATLVLDIAKNLGIMCASPHGTRLEHRAYFNNSEQKTFPILRNKISTKSKINAQNLLTYFYKNNKLPYSFSRTKKFATKNLFLRVLGRLNRIFIHKEDFEYQDFRNSFFANLPYLKNISKKVKKARLSYFFDINNLEDLPSKFIYFPLQVYPEASIHIPSPFFKHQERLVDLIRLNMPNDFKLVIKEHPIMAGRRKTSFYKKMKKQSGVRLINTNVNSNEIIKKSSLVISVSGTAVLEAFLYKKPSFSIGQTTFYSFTNFSKVDLNDFKKTILKYLDRKIDSEEIINYFQLLFENTYNFNNYGIDYSPSFTISEKNILNFVNALTDYLVSEYDFKY